MEESSSPSFSFNWTNLPAIVDHAWAWLSYERHAMTAEENLLGRQLRPFILQLPGKTLPPSLPLILPSYSAQDRYKREGSPQLLRVNEECIDLLKTIRKPVAVLSICGPYRTGKSYFVSHLLRKPGAFQLGHSMEACTRGIWLSTTALECDEFVLLLLDTEGIGGLEEDKVDSYIMKLLVITALLSSTLVYNSNEVPQCSDLEQMRCANSSSDTTASFSFWDRDRWYNI